MTRARDWFTGGMFVAGMAFWSAVRHGNACSGPEWITLLSVAAVMAAAGGVRLARDRFWR